MPVVDEEGKTLKRLVSKSAIPWYKDFKSSKAYPSVLEEELDAFWEFTEKRWSEERLIRTEIATEVRNALATLHVQVFLGGSAGVGVEIPGGTCELSLVPSDPSIGEAEILETLRNNCWWVDENPEGISIRNASGMTTKVSLEPVSHLGLRRNLQRLVNMQTHLKKTVKVLGQILRQSNLLTESNGGVSEYGLLVMTSSALATLPVNGNPVHHVLSCYGKAFDSTQFTATVTGAVKGGAGPGGLFVAHPVVPSVNLTASCRRFIQIRELCNYCHMMLAKWDIPSAKGSSAGRKPYSYKGKSPLSSVIAFKNIPKENQPQRNLPPPPPPVPVVAACDSDDELPPLMEEPGILAVEPEAVTSPFHQTAFLFEADPRGNSSIWGAGVSTGGW